MDRINELINNLIQKAKETEMYVRSYSFSRDRWLKATQELSDLRNSLIIEIEKYKASYQNE